MGGDSTIGPAGSQPFVSSQPQSIEDILIDKLNASAPNDPFQLTTQLFESLSPSDARDLFDQLKAFNNVSSQFNREFDGTERAKLLGVLQSRFEEAVVPTSDPGSAPDIADPKLGVSIKQELGIIGSMREAQIANALFEEKISAAPDAKAALPGGQAGASKVFKTRNEALAFAGGVNNQNAAVYEDQNHQWHVAQPNKDQWLQGRKEIHDLLEIVNNTKIPVADRQQAQLQLNEAYRNTLAAALGVPASEINVVTPNNPPDSNKINFDPSLKGKEGTAGAAKLDGSPKSIVVGPDGVKLDNPFDTIDVVAHEASHVRLANDGNKLLAEWQNIKGTKPDFPKWLQSQYKQKKISAEVLVTTASAYKGGRNPSEAISYINGFIASFAKDRAAFQKAQGFNPSDALVNSDLAQAASFSPDSIDLSTQDSAALKKELITKLQDFYKTLDEPGRRKFEQAMTKAIKDNPKSWLAAFKYPK